MLEDPTFWRMHTLANLMDYIGEIYTQEANTIYLYIVRQNCEHLSRCSLHQQGIAWMYIHTYVFSVNLLSFLFFKFTIFSMDGTAEVDEAILHALLKGNVT